MTVALERITEELTNALLSQVRSQLASEGWFQVEASGRHVHLATDDAKALFGEDYYLIWSKYLSQPGQFVGEQRMSLVGPKGRLENVVVIGPERTQTQVEISLTDALTLGVRPPCRESGELLDTPSVRLEFGSAWIETRGGLIVAERHVHMKPETAFALGIKDGDRWDFEINSSRPLVFKEVKVRVSPEADNFMHVDYDEANAAGLSKGMFGFLRKP